MTTNLLHSYIQDNEIYDNEFISECTDYNAYPTVIKHQERVIAIGDIHGDMNLAINFLKKAKVIKEICKKYLDDKIVKEHKYILKLNKTGLTRYVSNYDDDFTKNNGEIVYRYYEVFNSDNSFDDFYVKIVQEDNSPNDLDSEEDKLKQCKLFDKDRWFKWTGENTYVVQVGDQIDRCRPYGGNTCESVNATKKDEDSDLEIMLFYDSVDKIAIHKKGRVFSLLGNHEIMNVDGDMRYVSHKGIREYSPEPKNIHDGLTNRRKTFKTVIAKKMACTRSTVIIIGDYLFVHGGIASKLAYKYKLLDINEIIRKFLNSLKSNHDVHQLLNSSKISPLWYRQLAYIPQDVDGMKHPNCNKIFDTTVDAINELNQSTVKVKNKPTIQIKGMVIGHTPQFTVFGTGITTACHNNIIRVDIGASMAFDVFSADIKRSNPDIPIEKSREPQVIEILTNLKTKESLISILK